MMGSMEIVSLVLFTVYYNFCSSHIYHEVGSIWYIIQLLSCDTTIDDVEFNYTNFMWF